MSYALAQLQRMGRESGAYTVIIRTDSDIISFTPKMTDGTTPASGGPSLCNIDAILFAGHRNVPLTADQKRDLVSALRDRGVGFVSLFIGTLPNTDWPEMHNILGAGNAASDVHDPFGGASTFINERPDSPFTKHLPRVWDLPNGAVYHPDAYTEPTSTCCCARICPRSRPLPTTRERTGTIRWPGRRCTANQVFVSTIGNSEALWDNADLLKCTTKPSSGRWG